MLIIGMIIIIIYIYSYINLHKLHLYSAFLGTQSALHRRGESPQTLPVCSIHLDDATVAILRQNAHHTPAYWWRGDRVMKPISVRWWLGGHDGQRPMGKFGQDAGVTPIPHPFKGHPGIFNDHRVSGPRFNVSSEGHANKQLVISENWSLYWSVTINLVPIRDVQPKLVNQLLTVNCQNYFKLELN